MDPKFIKLEQAAEQLQTSTDRLNQLREQGALRAYRDGASWKFRTEDIDNMAEKGMPALEPEESGFDLGDLSLGDSLSLDDEDASKEATVRDADEEPLAAADSGAAASARDVPGDGDVLGETDDLDLVTGSSADLSLDLDDDEAAATTPSPPPAGGGSDLELDLPDSDDDPESILLSEAELGESTDGPASTIIGKADLDSDLELASETSSKDDPGSSDVRLVEEDDDLIQPGDTGELPAVGETAANFDDIEELEIDLEAESSRILSPEDVAAARAATAGSQQQAKAPPTSDLDLEQEDDYELAAASDIDPTGRSSSQINLDEDASGSGSGLTGLSALELDDDDDDDDDFVLGDGSDLTLSSADSGINLSPADSGMGLEEAAIDLTGSALGSGLDFSEAVGDGSGLLSDEAAGEGFELTPLAEDAVGEDDDDSSQVIALDEFEEQEEAEAMIGGPEMAPAGMTTAAVVPRSEAQFSGWLVFFLTLCVVLLSLCGMMVIDVVRSMWSWDEPYAVNSTIIEGLRGIFFP